LPCYNLSQRKKPAIGKNTGRKEGENKDQRGERERMKGSDAGLGMELKSAGWGRAD
jgi:hypothetical protein